MDDSQTLIVEFVGPEEKIQKFLEELEAKVDKDDDLEIQAVTIRKN